MDWRNPFGMFGLEPKDQIIKVPPQPINKDVARDIPGLNYRREWKCPCGAELRIRCREPRGDGPSNFHPKFPAGALNWNGLAVERGWRVGDDNKVQCPACQRGMSIAQYREHRAAGGL